jgi:hypothetical protein
LATCTLCTDAPPAAGAQLGLKGDDLPLVGAARRRAGGLRVRDVLGDDVQARLLRLEGVRGDVYSGDEVHERGIGLQPVTFPLIAIFSCLMLDDTTVGEETVLDGVLVHRQQLVLEVHRVSVRPHRAGLGVLGQSGLERVERRIGLARVELRLELAREVGETSMRR